MPTVGVIGAGQLARMLVEAAIPLDVGVRVLARTPTDAAAAVADGVVVGTWQDAAAVAAFAEGCDAITFDHELATPEALATLDTHGVAVRPSVAAMAAASDKAAQRVLAAQVGLGVVRHSVADDVPSLRAAVGEIGFPAVVKATRGGYDGRAVWWLNNRADLVALLEADPTAVAPVLVEPVLEIAAELATLVARRSDGSRVVYPVVRTEQRDGICTTVTAPAATTTAVEREAHAAACAIADALDYVGVLAVELFVIDGALHLNELAPRPHNSGHYTIDACVTSQFENHLRAVLDWPLGDPAMTTSAAVMANLIGTGDQPLRPDRIDPPPGARIHLYGKTPRAGRKLGHVTVCGGDRVALARTARDLARQLTDAPILVGGAAGEVQP